MSDELLKTTAYVVTSEEILKINTLTHLFSQAILALLDKREINLKPLPSGEKEEEFYNRVNQIMKEYLDL